jgi:hypothetical protein
VSESRRVSWGIVVFLLLSAVRAEAATSLTLAWDPNPETQVAGYVLRVGTAPGVYTQSFDVGRVTSFAYQPVVPGQRYCFAVSAYFAGPINGANSTEVCGYGDQAPTLISPVNQSSVIGQADSLQLQGSDPDGRPVTYAVSTLPSGLSLMPSTGLITGTPTTAQTVNLTATVSDGVLSASRSFSWTVRPPLAFVSLTADRVAPLPANTPVTFTASATGGAAPYQYRWWVHDGTAWLMVRDWTTSAAFIWTPSTANANYRVTVWIKDANSVTTTWDVSGTIAFPITAPLQVVLSADRTAPQIQGASIALTAAASGGKSPYQYRWWVHDGTNWLMLRDWTTSPGFTWTPAAANPNYRITVWVKNADSQTTTWDASAAMPFPITPPLQVALAADRFAPQAPSTTVTFTASGTGGKGPYQYRWWVHDGTSWTMLRDWSSSPIFAWTPPVANAAYRVTVWAKNADSATTTWDASASMAFAIQ